MSDQLTDVRTSDQINEVATALSKAQAEIEMAEKDSTNPHFNKSYAGLASVWRACRDAITKQGLAICQLPELSESGVSVTTFLLHGSGQWIRGKLTVPLERATAQGVGSGITYARRYALAAMVGVAPDEDDDGNGASGTEEPTTRSQGTPNPRPSCPQCNKTESVYANKQGPGYFCWKQRGGCGHNWTLTPAEPPAGKNGHTLSDDHAAMFASASLRIHEAQTEEDLDLIVASVADYPEPVKVNLRELYRTRREVIRTGDKTDKPF